MRTELQRRFDGNPKTAGQMEDIAELRTGAYRFAELIESKSPPGRERATAINKVEEAMHWAIAAVERPPAAGGRDLTMERRGSSTTPTQDPPTSPGYYRAFRENTGWVVVHVTEVSGVLWAEWLGTEKLLSRDGRWAAWDHTRVELPESPPTITLATPGKPS